VIGAEGTHVNKTLPSTQAAPSQPPEELRPEDSVGNTVRWMTPPMSPGVNSALH